MVILQLINNTKKKKTPPLDFQAPSNQKDRDFCRFTDMAKTAIPPTYSRTYVLSPCENSIQQPSCPAAESMHNFDLELSMAA